MQDAISVNTGSHSGPCRRPDGRDLGSVLGPLRLEPRPSARDLVVDLLRKAILKGQMRPGQRLPEEEVARQLNVSRMPVREAFGILETEGLLQRLPNRGVVVAELSLEEVEEVFRLRSLLEGAAAEHAARRMDESQRERMAALAREFRRRAERDESAGVSALYLEFHSLVWAAAGRTLGSLCQILYQRFPKDMAQVRPVRGAQIAREHQALVEALVQRDPVGAGEAMRRHIDGGCRFMIEHLRELRSVESVQG